MFLEELDYRRRSPTADKRDRPDVDCTLVSAIFIDRLSSQTESEAEIRFNMLKSKVDLEQR